LEGEEEQGEEEEEEVDCCCPHLQTEHDVRFKVKIQDSKTFSSITHIVIENYLRLGAHKQHVRDS